MAVAVTKDTQYFMQLAIALVPVAYRLGIAVARRTDSIERTTGSWTTTVSGLQLSRIESILEEHQAITVGVALNTQA